MPETPIFVPIVLEEDQALHVLGALRAVFQSGQMAGGDAKRLAPLAQAMVKISEATDAARAARLENAA